ncbi:MAG TPA: DUF805 domain-containing protein [Agriterribacter sp.]|nr:DUF805 domain-containing protein [Chitinophagaceae bacterium]HRP33395.1 DUF805 domain-containing protein [Agriterribacter sp.]
MEQPNTNLSMIGWWKKVVIENYANFNGRARRAEYWFFSLGSFLMLIAFYFIGIVGAFSQSMVLTVAGIGLYLLLSLGLLVPSIAVAVRRLHDLNKSGWYYLIGLIPLVGPIILLVWFFTDGDRFVNKYGDDPKNPAGPVFDFEKDQQL